MKDLKRPLLKTLLLLCALTLLCPGGAGRAQTPDEPDGPKNVAAPAAPAVVQVDEVSVKEVLRPEGRPLLVNFWATWCEPCRDEFPELVEIDREYRGRIDFITISLDDPVEIKRDVPKFLREMKASMPTYLLRTADENAVIGSISNEWTGGLPFTVLYDAEGRVAHVRQGRVKLPVLRERLDSLLAAKVEPDAIVDLSVARPDPQVEYERGLADARRDVAAGKFHVLRYGLTPGTAAGKYVSAGAGETIEIREYGCLVTPGLIAYIRGYNEVSLAEIKRRFGLEL